MKTFEELGVDGETLKAIKDLGFENPTPIQEQAIPALIDGNRDFVGLAQTGTGKTAAFGLPLCRLIDFSSKKTQALILAPTRELCVQINNDLINYTKYKQGANIVAVYGGASIQTQISQIRRGAQIVVATPGRLLDLISRRGIDITEIGYVVLDEADEMLNMGFQEDITEILSNTPFTKQTWLFSATMPSEVRRIAERFMTNPAELSVSRNTAAVNIEHVYYMVHARDKYAALKRIIDFQPEIFGIVFCRTKLETQEIAEHLIKDGYNADSLHGDLSQQQRDKVMNRYRERALQLLIATDVAARGIDVSNVTHVINYNLPDDLESYTHRSGRTARAGKSGVSIAIINMKEVGKLRQIERFAHIKFRKEMIPTGAEVCEKQLFHLIHRVHEVTVNEKEIEVYLPKINKELADLSKEEIIKRFASIEFNRFLNYYKSSRDLNVEMSAREGRPERGEKYSDRSDFSGEREIYRKDNKNADRLFISLGKADGLDAGQLLRMVATKANIPGSKVGKIEIKGVYSFIDVDKNLSQQVIESLNNTKFQDRTVRVEVSAPGSKEGSGERSGGNRDRGDRGSERRSSGGERRSFDGKGRGYEGRGSSDRKEGEKRKRKKY